MRSSKRVGLATSLGKCLRYPGCSAMVRTGCETGSSSPVASYDSPSGAFSRVRSSTYSVITCPSCAPR